MTVVSELLARLKADPESVIKDGAGLHKEAFVARAPGRLDVMGGVIEATGGLACQMPVEAGTAVALQRRDDRQLVIKTYNGMGGPPTSDMSESVVTLSLDDFYGTASLLPHEMLQRMFAGGRQWAAHVAGAFPTLGKHKKITRRTHGANIACYSNVPVGAGMGSSAALECATLWAITAAYHLILDPLEIALLAQKIENHIVGKVAGVLDTATCVLGLKDQLMVMQCQPHEIKGFVGVPAGTFLAGVTCGGGGGVKSDAMRVGGLMAQAMIALFYRETGVKKDPTRGYLGNVTAESFEKYFARILPEEVTGEGFLKEYGGMTDRMTVVEAGTVYRPRAAAEFCVRENTRVERFVGAIRMDDPRSAGKWMNESHAAWMGADGTAKAGLAELVERVRSTQGLHGARAMVGGDGVVVLGVESGRAGLEGLVREISAKHGVAMKVVAGSSSGAAEAAPRRVTVAEIS